jgi:hypothetical protein
MWENLSPVDIERAKAQLRAQREEILKRQAEELSVLDADQNEIDTLDRLIAAFIEGRVQAPAVVPEAPAAVLVEPPEIPMPAPATPASTAGDRPAAIPVRPPSRRDYSGTNFDTFSNAVSKLI